MRLRALAVVPSRVEVALPLPVDQTFTYALGPDAPRPVPGTRVLVPFHRAKRVGWVVGPGRPGSGKLRLRRISRVLEDKPSISPNLLELARWMAAYYIVPLGLVLRTALPSVLCRTGRGPGTMARTRKVAHIVRWLESLAERDAAFARAPRQQAAYETLERAAGSLPLASLLDQGIGRGVVKALEGKGIVEVRDQEVVRDPFASTGTEPPPDLTPNPAQAAALRRLVSALDAPAPRPVLLHGVTASGKTLVYIELLKEVVDARAGSAIVLVPEISLTPQTVTRFRAHFGDRVAVLHSGLSDGERYDAWRQLRSGARRIAIGARSAIFAPLPDLGAIIVDEEHEGSYKQSDAPRYHARDVAIMRARREGALCLLGSATPSLESWSNQAGGKFELLRLPERATGGQLPPVRVVDLREPSSTAAASPRNGGRPARPATTGRTVLSPELTAAIRTRLERGEQSILLLNRRGYSTFFQCRECGDVPVCAACSVSLTFHRATGRLLCHHCRYEEPVPDTCRRCGSRALLRRGLGTEQVERVVTESFPGARVARMDVDTTARKWAHSEILGRVGRGEVDILLGTQMIAKGLDYPRVTLVGVVDADVGLHLPDFRASERTFQLLSQVAGRAGRGTLGGEVLIQTRMPGHYAIRAACEHDFEAFAERELAERAGPGYPPLARLVNVVVTSPDPEAAATAAEEAAGWVERRLSGAAVELTGPAPAPIERLQGRWRWHFLLRSRSARALGTLTRAFSTGFRPPSDARVLIDRDPMALL